MASDDENARKSIQLLQEPRVVLLYEDLQPQLVPPAFPAVERLVFVRSMLEIVVVVPQGHRGGLAVGLAYHFSLELLITFMSIISLYFNQIYEHHLVFIYANYVWPRHINLMIGEFR